MRIAAKAHGYGGAMPRRGCEAAVEVRLRLRRRGARAVAAGSVESSGDMARRG